MRQIARVVLPLTLLLFWQLGCEGSRKGKEDSLEQAAFERKKFCAKLGQARLAQDQKAIPAYFRHSLTAEWCYSTSLRTCVYSSDTTYFGRDEKGNDTYDTRRETIDLLTNQTILSLNNEPAKMTEYYMKRNDIFSKCLK